MEKIDLKKNMQYLYLPSAKEAVQVDVPIMNFLMVDGAGDPNTAPVYAEAVEALFTLSYALKFMIRKSVSGIDYGVMPLEGLWWTDDMTKFTTDDKSAWKWTMMIMQPDFVTPELVDSALAEVRRKKNPVALARVRFAAFQEGRCAQILHIGPFSEEGPSIARLHDFIAGCGSVRTGKHHEIYLSDIRRANPIKWKTVIRQPMQQEQAP